jgi:hypothetical protein
MLDDNFGQKKKKSGSIEFPKLVAQKSEFSQFYRKFVKDCILNSQFLATS